MESSGNQEKGQGMGNMKMNGMHWREVGNHGMILRSWPRIERGGRCLCVACALEQGQ